MWICLASHKEGTTTHRWKHQHPKRTYCQNSTCVGKWCLLVNYIQGLYQTIPARIREVITTLGWRVTWQNIKVRYCFNHFYLTFVPKLKFCSNDVTTSKSQKLMSVDCTNNKSGIFYHLHDLVCVCSRQ